MQISMLWEVFWNLLVYILVMKHPLKAWEAKVVPLEAEDNSLWFKNWNVCLAEEQLHCAQANT